MQIARVEPLLIGVPYAYGGPAGILAPTMRTLFVKVTTDEGIVGWGEAFGFAIAPVTALAIETIVAPLCIGRDPRDPAALTTALQQKLQNLGRYGPVTFGLSGLDIALWDIAGKVAGKPLHALLGGARRTQIPIYASLLRLSDPALVGVAVERALAGGYRHVKLHEHTVATVAVARRTAGDGIPLMLDVNCAWSVDEAIAAARELEPYALHWLEEPVWPPEDLAALTRVRGATRIPIAAGENAATPTDVRALLHTIDVVQPSVTKIGGVTALRDLYAAAVGTGATIVPHSPYVGPGLIATLHVMAALDPAGVGERYYCDLEASPLGSAVVVHDGMLAVPDGPGLGIEVDEGVIARYRVRRAARFD
jgi:D-galactarolactone cycloisomerase